MNCIAHNADLSKSPRIWIVGQTGSGKSTLAELLGKQFDRMVIHLDDLLHLPGWKMRDANDVVADIKQRIAKEDAWIIEGNYREVRQQFLDQIDLLIWLDYPLRTTFPRLLGRTWRRCRTGEEVCNGNRETFRKALLSHDSILFYSLLTHRKSRNKLVAASQELPTICFRSPGELTDWVAVAR